MKTIKTWNAQAKLKSRLAAGTALPLLLLALGGMPLMMPTGVLAASGYCSTNGNVTLSDCGVSGVDATPTDPAQDSSLTIDSGTDTIGDVVFNRPSGPTGSGTMTLEIVGGTTIVAPELLAGAGVAVGNEQGDVNVNFGSDVSITHLGFMNATRKGVMLVTGGGDIDLVTGATIDAGGTSIWALNGGGNITIENSGSVTAQEGNATEGHGIYANSLSATPFFVQITNTEDGFVNAYNDGLAAIAKAGDAVADNFGTVFSTTGTGVLATSENGDATARNAGLIQTMTGAGLKATAVNGNVLIENEGVVNALGTEAGIVARADTGTVRIVNSGSLFGFNGIESKGGDVTIDNSGAIMGMTEDGGDAISLSYGEHTLILSGDAAVVGDIAASGHMDIDAMTDVTLDYGIKDQASLPLTGLGITKKGEGTLTLTGNNTYSGGTRIEEGALAIQQDANLGDASGGLTFAGGILRLQGDLVSARSVTVEGAGGTLDTQDNDAALSGSISGSGNLNKAGFGVLMLTGDSSGYAGTLTVSNGLVWLTGGSIGGRVDIRPDGTLAVGNGGNDGDLLADTTNDGTLIFNQVNDYDYTGNLDGSGSLVKQGSGELTLSGEYRYTGSTVVEGGSMRLASGLDPNTDLVLNGGTFDLSGRDQTVAGLSGTGGNLLLGTGSLTVNQNADSTFGGSIDGTGLFVKDGPNRLNLTGNSPFTGSTHVNGGTLAVNGSLAGSPVTVNTGGTLGGNGTVGGLNVGNGGVVAPGNSIGTLKVAGDVTFGLGSVYEVETNANGQADRIDATGRATINGGTVRVLAENGTYKPTTDYTILTAQGGVTGRFVGVTSNFAFLNPSLAYRADEVILTLSRNSTEGFSSVAQTPNQFNTASAVEALGSGHRVYDAIVGQSVTGARQAFDALSGEVHAGVTGTLIENSRLVREAVINRLGGDYGSNLEQWAFWGQGFGSWGQSDKNGNAGQLDRSTTGFLIGLEGDVAAAGNVWRLGVAGGYTNTSLDLDARSSSAEIDSYHLAVYGGTRFGAFGVRGGAAYTWNQIDAKRSITFPGFSDSVTAKYDARTAQVFGEVGYRFDLGGFNIEPIAGLTYVNVDVDGFRELGGGAALSGLGGSQDVTYSTLGARFSTDVAVSGGTTLNAKGMLGWRHAFDDVDTISKLKFGGGSPFAISSLPIAKDALVMEAGIEMKIGNDVTVSVSYGGQYARKVQDHSVKGALEVRF